MALSATASWSAAGRAWNFSQSESGSIGSSVIEPQCSWNSDFSSREVSEARAARGGRFS